MTSVEAYTLLQRVAFLLEREKQVFNRIEIQKKMNEIKYLSSQKKIPRISLRKEIIHLEYQLNKIDALERQLKHQQLRNDKKYQFLKRENNNLRQKLATFGDKDLTQKINTISYALSDSRAMEETSKEVALSKLAVSAEQRQESPLYRMQLLQRKIDMLKQELEASRINKTMNSEKIRIIENQIDLFEARLLRLTEKQPPVQKLPAAEPLLLQNSEDITEASGKNPAFWKIPEEKTDSREVKHDIIFHELPPKNVVLSDEEKELPLPPPPKELVRKA